MGASTGKSRVHGYLTHMYLHLTEANIFVLFEHNRLLERDLNQNNAYKIFGNAGQKKTWDARVKYQVGFKGISGGKKQKVVIIDESDAVMFKDFLAFYNATKGENITVIGLTATAFTEYDSNEAGVKKEALELLSYQLIRTQPAHELKEPYIT